MQTVLDDIADAWGISHVALIAETGHATLWKVRSRDWGQAALKLYRRADRGNEASGTQLLAQWQQRGAVRIYIEAQNAILMEWLEGPTLGEIARDGKVEKALGLFADTARKLHASPTEAFAELRPLETVICPLLVCPFADDCPDKLQQDVMRARNLAQTLLKDQAHPVPLHGDLHPDNVILTSAGPRVIDAKGYLGDPAFELANALRHPKGLSALVQRPEQIERCLTLYSDAMQVPRGRLAQWAAVKCAVSIMWRGHGTVSDDREAGLLGRFLQIADQ